MSLKSMRYLNKHPNYAETCFVQFTKEYKNTQLIEQSSTKVV